MLATRAQPRAAPYPLVINTQMGYSDQAYTGNFTVTFPEATAGNLLVVIMVLDTARTITPPSGWSANINLDSPTGRPTFIKTAVGGETSAVFSTSGSSLIQAVVLEISDANTATAAFAFSSTASNYPDPPSCTAEHSGKKYLAVAIVIADGYSNLYTPETITGYVRYMYILGNASYKTIVVCAKSAIDSATEDPGTLHLATSLTWSAITLMIYRNL